MDFSLEVMAARGSVRSFDGRPIVREKTRALIDAMEACASGPFGGTARFALVSAEAERSDGEGGDGVLAKNGKIGTYGLISKVPAFIVGAISRGPKALEDFGYSMEGLVLKATELGLGSCWIGGLFDRGAAAKALGRREDELLPAVVAIGMPAERRSLAESLTRRLARADSRKAPSVLFFDEVAGRPLSLADSPWLGVFEALRMGPSASNKQPWRIVARGTESKPRFDLYLDEDRAYNSALGEIHIQNIDMGIAMRHFESAARSLGLPGGWSRTEKANEGMAAHLIYISSWV
ncbi:MAG TPA: nitroreductase family protein [Rectinemataceae bacterium]|nr:nitroreductase family protein [Rectinemataceae bacterium]